jgi:hypothetical protein
MSAPSTTTGPSPAPQGLLARAVGIIVSPRETYESVVAHPKWLGMLALVAVTLGLVLGLFFASDVGRQAWLDQTVSASEAAGRTISDQQYAGMERISHYLAYIVPVQIIVFTPILYLIVSGILFAVFNAGLGGEASYKQVFTVVTHAGVIGILQVLFATPMNYLRGSMTSATSLGVLLPMLTEGSFLGRLFGMIDVFYIWQVVVLGIGLAVLYRRRTQPIATALLGVYVVIAAIIALVMSRMGGA